MWTHGSGEPGIRLFLGAWVVMGVACGDEGGTSDGSCEARLPDVPSASVAPVQGSVRVQDTVNFNVQGTTVVEELQTAVAGGFERIVSTSTPAQFLTFGTQCLGFTSRRIPGEVELLDGGPLRVTAALGAETIEPDDDNVYRSPIGGEQRLEGVPQVEVSGGGAASAFPAFTSRLAAPAALRLDRPATDGSARLPTSELEFEWEPGLGDIVLLSIAPQPPVVSGGSVQCFFTDDGCGVVPASATTFLRSNNAERYVVVMTRIIDERLEPEPDVTMDVELATTIRFQLAPGD